jgi:hypothetical protein
MGCVKGWASLLEQRLFAAGMPSLSFAQKCKFADADRLTAGDSLNMDRKQTIQLAQRHEAL